MRGMMIGSVLLAAGWIFSGCGESGGGHTDQPAIVIGGIWAEDVDELVRKEMWAAMLAVDEINASGVFDRPVRLVNRSPARGDLIDPDQAAEGVRELYDQEHAVAFVSGHGYDTVYHMIAVTNSEPYQDFVQCSEVAADPGANMPGMAGWDANDTFYRTTVTYQSHLDLGTKLIVENQWSKIGLFRFDNPAGQELSLGVRLKIADYSDQGFSLAFDQPVPNEAFDLDANREDLNRITEMSRSGDVDVSIVAVLQAQTLGITKYLVENDYQGCLFQTAGSETSDLFHVVNGLTDWLAEGNSMIGVEPDAYQGENSGAFLQAFENKFDQQPDSYGPNSYDCVYALVFAMLYAGPENYTAAGVKAGMQNFKESNRTDDEVEVGIGAQEFARAAELIRQGKRIDFQGASGRLLFDDYGDRPNQGMRTFGPNQSVTNWEVKDRYDADLNKI